MDATGWNVASAIPEILADTEPVPYRDFETFSAHQAGFCPRQLYLATLGLRDDSESRGRLQASGVIQEFVQDRLKAHQPEIEVDPRMAVEAGEVRFLGRPTAIDPDARTVWHVKPRNGWYRFHPPNERHLDQLQVYMQGLEANHGKLVYISMADLHDVRTWPEDSMITADPDRFQAVVDRAEAVRASIMADGIATCQREIPFERCGCFLCKTESVEFPQVAEPGDNGLASEAKGRREADTEWPNTKGGQPETPDLTEANSTLLETTGTHVPAALRDRELWVVWDGWRKVPLAPWQSGTMYPCQWAADGGTDPRGSYRRAKMVAELPVEEIHRSWPFPDSDDLPEQVRPGILLPHDPSSAGITVVDFDQVREPDTGRVAAEVVDLLEEFGCYAEESISGTGIHAYVRGTLPEDIPSVSGALSSGSIEIYDHSRFTAGTWRHLDGTPKDELTDASGLLTELASQFAGVT